MPTTLSIRAKLYAGFILIVVILVALLVSAYTNFTSLSEANGWDRHTLQVIIESKGIETSALDIQGKVRGFLLTGSDRYINQFDEVQNQLREHIQNTRRLTADNPVQQERLGRLETSAAAWISSIVNPLIEKRRQLPEHTNGAADTLARDPLLAQSFASITGIRQTVKDLENEENRLLAERSKHVDSLRQSMALLLTAGGAVCVFAALITALVLSRSILLPLNNLADTARRIAGGDESARAEVVRRDELGQVSQEINRMAQALQDNQVRERDATNLLKDKVDTLMQVVARAAAGDLTGKVTISGDDSVGRLGAGLATMFDNLRTLLNRVQSAGVQVTTSTTEIAASAKQQEATGIEQAQTSIEILSTTKEISANTTQLLKTMAEASDVAQFTTDATAEAQINLKRMDLTMQTMVSATASINDKLAALSDKASNINNVLTTITKVADQTNILSLNAAIEAEKAGEAGRGFSVVATEIRRLADQTSVATWDIEQMLKEMQSAVSASVMGMDKFSEEMRRSVGEVRQIGEQLSGVIDQVQKLPPRFDAILEGMQSQSIGASQITETMRQLNDASQQTVDALRATSEAVQQLQYAAHDLQASVGTFSVAA